MKFLILPVIAFFMMFAPAAMAQPANGNNLVRVNYNNGVFEWMGGDQWIERTFDGNDFYFRETKRNRKFVELYDGSRGYYINLDTVQWVIWIAGTGEKYRKMVDITSMDGN